MMSQVENNDDDSFIILGTSPGTSLDIKCNGDVVDGGQMEEAMKDLSVEATMAFKAHFKLGDCPSPASMMVASTIVNDDKSTEELQKRFGELLDENVILKETLKQNNDSMKEQFLLIASCQEDMMKTHMMHKEKFEETKGLVEKLRQENKKLKQEMVRLGEGDSIAVNSETGENAKSGPPSALEFVTSPDDDTINKLTAQLELVEKQRRQVIVDNEKLTWQKESLEHIVDATSKERDDIREKLKNVEMQLSGKDSEYAFEISKLKSTVQDLENQLQIVSSTTSLSSDEVTKRDAIIRQLDTKVSTLQNELRNAQLKILESENVKLEFSKHKSGVSETVKMYKDQIQDLNNRLKEASTTVFQPVRLSLSSESPEHAGFTSNVKLYDRTLKHLAQLLNALTEGLSDSLVQSLGVISSLYDFKLDRTSVDQFKSGLAEVKLQLEKQHSMALHNIGQVRGTMSIFDGIFKDFDELVKKSLNQQETKPATPVNVEALTAALVARGQELQMLEAELNQLKIDKGDKELLKAQLDLYKSDFEAERESREKMASEKENILTDLRKTQRRNQELVQQLEEVRKLTPSVHRTVTSRKSGVPSAPARHAPAPAAPAAPTAAHSNTAAGNMVYTCPKCMKFSCDQYKVMEDHFDFCLDDF